MMIPTQNSFFKIQRQASQNTSSLNQNDNHKQGGNQNHIHVPPTQKVDKCHRSSTGTFKPIKRQDLIQIQSKWGQIRVLTKTHKRLKMIECKTQNPKREVRFLSPQLN